MPAPGTAPKTSGGSSWFKSTWFLATATAAVGLVVGVAIGGAGSDPTTTEEYQALAADLEDTSAELDEANSELADTEAALEQAKADLGDLPDRELELKALQSSVDAQAKKVEAREAAVAKLEKSVAARERRVGIVEKEVARNTMPGDGVYQVGKDMKPGTYKSTGNSSCYWKISSDPNGSNIIENNIVDGQALVSVPDGRYFETSGCSEWVLQR